MWFPGIDNNAFLIAGEQATLVDVGPPRKTPAVLDALPGTGLQASDVRHVVVTHHHTDHTGQLAAVARGTDAPVYAHPEDSGVIRDGAERPRGTPHDLLGKALAAMAPKSSKADPVAVDVEVAAATDLPAAGGLRAIPTPGHTPGHVSYLWPTAGVLFVGDAAANMFRRLGVAPLNEDLAAARESFRALAGLDFDVACFGHGSPIVGGAAARFRKKL
jgi:glyoxylase-like metal-dependent hydrolase (beta-lactamase superfamily II)